MKKQETPGVASERDLLRFGVRFWPVLEAPHPHDVWKETPAHEN